MREEGRRTELKEFFYHTLDWFPKATIINYHSLEWLESTKTYSVTVLEDGSPNQGVSGLVPTGGPAGETIPCFSPTAGSPCHPWCSLAWRHIQSLSPSSCGIVLSGLSLCFLFLKKKKILFI